LTGTVEVTTLPILHVSQWSHTSIRVEINMSEYIGVHLDTRINLRVISLHSAKSHPCLLPPFSSVSASSVSLSPAQSGVHSRFPVSSSLPGLPP
jgi:hypothetical protein